MQGIIEANDADLMARVASFRGMFRLHTCDQVVGRRMVVAAMTLLYDGFSC